MRRNSVAIIGYYGFKNAGDELMLRCLLDSIRGIDGNAKIIAFSNIPRDTEQLHGVPCVAFHYNFWGGASFFHSLTILRSDLLVFGGGSFLQDYGVNGWRGVAAYLKLVLTAKLLRKKVIILGAGAGPLQTQRGRFLSKLLVNLADWSVWRDPDSITLLKEIGCRDGKLQLGTDLLLSCPSIRSASDKMRDRGRKHVGVSFFGFHDYVHGDRKQSERYFDEVVNLTIRLSKEGYTVHFFCMQRDFAGKDNLFASAVKARIPEVQIVDFFTDPDAFLDKLRGMDFAIGMRYHFLLLCYLMKIPLIGISYNPKVASLLRELELDRYTVEVDGVNADSLFALFKKLTGESISFDFASRVPGRIEANAHILNKFLTQG